MTHHKKKGRKDRKDRKGSKQKKKTNRLAMVSKSRSRTTSSNRKSIKR